MASNKNTDTKAKSDTEIAETKKSAPRGYWSKRRSYKTRAFGDYAPALTKRLLDSAG